LVNSEPLADEAWVVRGGIMRLVTLRVAIDLCLERHGFYGLSFFGDNGLSVTEIVQLADDRLPQPLIRISNMERIREAGFEPYRSLEYPHLTVRFEMNPSDEELERLTERFDEPVPNPHKAK
jgi:hypothetical protein